LSINEGVLEKGSFGTKKTTPGYDQRPIEPQTDRSRKVGERILRRRYPERQTLMPTKRAHVTVGVIM
jgi:hypothetical protein